jgi:membrane protease YdiL (CAAX protease family)
MYRGFIQRSITAQIGQIQALIATAIWFAAVHLQIVEFPGLFCFALVLGYLTLKTGTIGSSIYAHVAFNATGLLLIATS